jgi:outer membrane lipoprotein-sorting protein
VRRLTLPLWLISAALTASGFDQQQAFTRLDQAANGFRGLTAKIKKISHTAVIKESTEEIGRICLRRPKPRDLKMLAEFTSPEERAVAFDGRKVQIYYPRILTVQEYDLGKQSSLIDQFLLLGFGSNSSELKKSYDIKWTGEEAVNGIKCDHLELTPKSDEARQHVRSIEIWVSAVDGVTQQQKVHQPSRDYVLITYSEIKLNPPLTDDSTRLKLPKGVKKETPQK